MTNKYIGKKTSTRRQIIQNNIVFPKINNRTIRKLSYLYGQERVLFAGRHACSVSVQELYLHNYPEIKHTKS